MKKITAFLSGKKVFIVGGATVLFGLLEGLGVDIPIWAWEVLGGIGLIAGRDTVRKIAKAIGTLSKEFEKLLPKD